MTTEWLADDAHRAFRELCDTLKPNEDINEANTRMRFIDQILFKVLRWDENDAWPEKYVKNVGYLDYEFGRPQCSLVLELFTNEPERYMALVMKFIRRSHHKSVAVFFDNLDRRADDIQEQAFLRAAAMANDWGVLVFVCLRPGTMQRSSASGVLDTMAPRTLVIPQPDIGIVLRKRFQYAGRYAARDLAPEAYLHERFDDETGSSCLTRRVSSSCATSQFIAIRRLRNSTKPCRTEISAR